MSKNEIQKGCACTQGLQDLLRAANKKNDLLRKITCANCGKEFEANYETEYCFDCAKTVKKK